MFSQRTFESSERRDGYTQSMPSREQNARIGVLFIVHFTLYKLIVNDLFCVHKKYVYICN